MAYDLEMESCGVGVPLLVITQLITSPAWIVKVMGTVPRPDTFVPDGLLFEHATVWA